MWGFTLRVAVMWRETCVCVCVFVSALLLIIYFLTIF